MGLKIEKSAYDEAQIMRAEGDIDVDVLRDKFKTHTGQETKLNDEQLAAVVMTQSDDDDDEFVANAKLAEADGIDVMTSTPVQDI